MMFPPHLIHGPHSVRPTPPTDAPDVPLAQFKAAQDAGAGWLSADGKRAYCQRFGAVLEAEWQGSGYGSWWAVEGLPGDAVVMR